jgi:hypothetical protein
MTATRPRMHDHSAMRISRAEPSASGAYRCAKPVPTRDLVCPVPAWWTSGRNPASASGRNDGAVADGYIEASKGQQPARESHLDRGPSRRSPRPRLPGRDTWIRQSTYCDLRATARTLAARFAITPVADRLEGRRESSSRPFSHDARSGPAPSGHRLRFRETRSIRSLDELYRTR